MTPEAVLFDYGGVFTESPFAAARRAFERLGIDPVQGHEWIFGSYEVDTAHPWHRLERGETSAQAARDEIMATAAAAGVELDPWVVLAELAGGETRAWMTDVLVAVHAAGVTTAIVTNNLVEFADHWKAGLPMDAVDVIVDSSAEGVRKPNPAIYRLALQRAGVKDPQSAVFVDDAPSNVAAARALGLIGLDVPHDIIGARACAVTLCGLLGLDPPPSLSDG
ncbi:MAG: HAD family phosphatase [Candidatus Microthrix parvicella]